MKPKQTLIIEHLDKKLAFYKTAPEMPATGWIHVIRMALKMSLRQLASRLQITVPSVKEMEEREKNGSITIRSLKEAAKALNMKFVYGLVPLNGTLKTMIDQKAEEVARRIVSRTSDTMRLEDQSVTKERLEESIKELTAELKNEMPRYLWD